MKVIYNEIDRRAAGWLRNLQASGEIPSGAVDERSIEDVQGSDLAGAQQAHFFAGIGGWPLALRLAGWPDERPVWTGSCPCQPFSIAGRAAGVSDRRHLWPQFKRLIEECHPPVVFGEQVASPLGREWLDGVQTDLEGLGYAFGSADLCAASVGAPQIRQRLWWVASAESIGHWPEGLEPEPRRRECPVGPNGVPLAGGLGCAAALGRLEEREILGGGDPREQAEGREQRPWRDFDVVSCRDGRSRRFEPRAFPLAHGVPGRVVKLRAYGNAIVPQVAAEFIRAYLEL